MIVNMKRVVSTLLLGLFVSFFEEVITEVVITPINVTVSENQAATLTCTLTGTSEAVKYFSWSYKSSSELNEAYAGILTPTCLSVVVPVNSSLYEYACPSNTQSTWTIKKVTRKNHGDRYKCNIETSSGNENSEFTFIQVQVPVSSVTMIVPSSESVTVNQNESKEFKCKTSRGLPTATVSWYKDSGTPGVSSDDVEITSNVVTSSSTVNDLIEVTSTLTYSPSKIDNGWRIYCTASNFNGQTPIVSTRKPLLNVQYPPDGPPVITGYTDGGEYHVVAGSQGQLSCSVSGGNPTPTLTWNCSNSGTPQTINSGTVTKLHIWIAKRGQDRTCTCIASHYSGNKDVSIRIITLSVPQTLQLDSPPNQDQDLAENVVTLRCRTGCSYPQPSLKWFYTEFGGSRKEWSSPGAYTSTTGGCTDSEKIYTSTLSLAKYSTFPGNLDKTVKFICGIPTYTGMTQPLYSNPSVNIQFAVQVTSVTLKDGNSEAPSSIKVTSGVPKTLTCTTSFSRPNATIIWFLSGKEQTRSNSSSTFTFTPNNNDHKKQIFCKAFNIQNESQAVTSHETTLYVQATLANPCLEKPCVRGTCFSHDSLFLCQCPKGYTGKLCENQVDPCEPNPCQHGTCFSHDLLFLCQCVNGYYGKTCERTVEPCRSNPCVHGTCFSRESEFLCKCQSGYTGERCDKIGDQSPSIVG